MQNISLGWGFLKQAWSMAFKDKDLLKPSIYALVAGFVVSVVGIIPLAIAFFVFGNGQFGEVVLFILGGALIFAQFMVSYVFSGMTAYLIYGYLSEGDGRMDKAWAIVRRDFWDILTLAAASTAVNLLKSAARNNKKNNLATNLMRSATGLLETLWTEASYLILPAMVIDDLNLKEGLQRVAKIAKENLLLVGVSTVGVKFVTGLITFVFSAIGFAIALAVGYGAVSLSGGDATTSIIGIVLAALIFFPFVMVASIFSSYINTAYHTCLYIWARDVEHARAQGSDARASAPAPLAAVLGY
ncbi:MAG: hypothetical protein Fur002_12740 [Anaerolineales bacterium]